MLRTSAGACAGTQVLWKTREGLGATLASLRGSTIPATTEDTWLEVLFAPDLGELGLIFGDCRGNPKDSRPFWALPALRQTQVAQRILPKARSGKGKNKNKKKAASLSLKRFT